MYFAVIMAGGGGTRFWPRSRQTTPKQLLPITSDKALIAETQERLADACPPEQTLIITNAKQVEGTIREVPALPTENIIAEPIGRNTAPCVGVAALVAAHRGGPEAVIGVFPADHCIAPVEEFSRTVRTAIAIAEREKSIVTIGIKPNFPATGYGYIEAGEAIADTDVPACAVKSFREKPNLDTAVGFVKAGSYCWNAGMFFARAETILSELQRQQPEIHRLLEELRPAIGTPEQDAALAAAYEAMPSISFDYAVMESAERVHMVEASFTWDDVGSWAAVERHFPADERGNVVRGECIAVKSKNNTVDSKRLVALVGCEDLIVVETDDAILVCKRDQAEEVKQVVETLKKDDRSELL
ncbi:MAG: mannose-1-phosphate guanylyltransferase [Planctomycetota bacterium]|jgi:mannose-1-phosphate guanylyltransferase